MTCANHPEREKVAFCQNCGKPLCQECTRTVGSAVFCEPCLAAKLTGAGSPPPADAGFPSSGSVGGGDYTATAGTYTYTDPATGFTVNGAVPPPFPPGSPNPGLAALLGIMPGVGAMYNGQYAKAVVHLGVFAILVSLADKNGIFGLFVAGWLVYQIFEAYQTARARRDGTPLPNPFGLNDLGERLGFGKSWPTTHHAAGAVPPVETPTAPYAPPSYSQGYAQVPPAYPQPPYAPPVAPDPAAWQSYMPPVAPYAATYPADPNNPPIMRNRFPAGALWLIGLGLIFLIGNAGFFHGFPVGRIIPFFLIGLGVWLFVHRMTVTGASLTDDGSPNYQLRVFSAMRGSIWVILVGVLFLLDSFDILSWARSWPLFIIVAGLMAIFQRTTYSRAASHSYAYPPVPPQAYAQPPVPGTSAVPPSHDQEGN